MICEFWEGNGEIWQRLVRKSRREVAGWHCPCISQDFFHLSVRNLIKIGQSKGVVHAPCTWGVHEQSWLKTGWVTKLRHHLLPGLCLHVSAWTSSLSPFSSLSFSFLFFSFLSCLFLSFFFFFFLTVKTVYVAPGSSCIFTATPMVRDYIFSHSSSEIPEWGSRGSCVPLWIICVAKEDQINWWSWPGSGSDVLFGTRDRVSPSIYKDWESVGGGWSPWRPKDAGQTKWSPCSSGPCGLCWMDASRASGPIFYLNCLSFVLFCLFLFAQARASDTILDRSGESGPCCSVPDLSIPIIPITKYDVRCRLCLLYTSPSPRDLH